MKKYTRYFQIAEALCLFAIIAGMLLKILDLPGADQMLMISMLSLALIYLTAGNIAALELKKYYATAQQLNMLNNIRILLAALSGIALSVFVTGRLFFILYLPGKEVMTMSGCIGCIVIWLIILCYPKKNYPHIFSIMHRRLGFVSFLTGVSVIMEIYYQTA